ncbi:E3 SUMO-protein ligase RanBP2 isoform X2 [Labeo rohita]|uniref:E3 SUMO-protein ligase RanBP2 isoform X2 n=1 Tax=Labeo rohita TaxID=84645 RepID=UPI0021E2E440|nr:E3 SUMO-protein ligase RanBP2 isoform X2 [Labeo rohita]
MRRTKADVERYISTVQSASPSQKARPDKGFLFAKLYSEAKEYELAKRHVSEYLTIQPKDPKAHKFLGQLFERDGETDKAVGCYKRSLDLNPAQHDLVLKVAELLCGKPDHDSRAEFWVDKAARLLPGHPTVFNLREKLLSAQSGSYQLYELLQSELKLRPADTYINRKLVQLYIADGQQEDAVKHCLAVEKAGVLRDCLEWYELLVDTLQEYLCQLNVSSNEQASRKFHKELLLALSSRVRLTLVLKGCEESTAALWSFDCAMQALKNTATNTEDKLAEVFTEMRAHLYLYAGTLLLKRAQDGAQQWRAVLDLATLCYLISYQSPRPKAKSFKGEQVSHEPLELLACDRQSQAGHMLLNLSRDVEQLLKDVVEAFGNRNGPGHLFDDLFGSQSEAQLSFICNDDIHILRAQVPKAMDLAKWDRGAVLLHAGDLQQLAWLGLQWALMGQSVNLQDWLKQLFPLLTLETSKLNTNTPESICLLDLEVFVCGVVFCSQTELQERAKMPSCSQPHKPRCLPLHIMKQLLSDRQREWWDAVYSLIHKRAPPEMTAKLRLVVKLGVATLRAGEEHGLQPALLIHWAKHLTDMVERVNDQKDYAGRSVHYWKAVFPLLEKIRHRRSIPEPLQPLFMHFRSRDIQPSQVRVYEEDADISFAILLDIEGNTEEAIVKLEKLNSISSNWHLAKIYQRLSEEEEKRLEETHGRCNNFLLMFRQYLTKIYQANAEDVEKLPVSMEEVMDSLNEVNQQLEDIGDVDEDQVDYPLTSSPGQPAEGHVKFSTPSPSKSVTSPSKRSVFYARKPPYWVKDQKSVLQMLCQQVKALQNEVHVLRNNSSDATTSSYRMYRDNNVAEGLQETFPGVPLTVATTGPSVYYNQSPAYNSQYLLRTAENVTPAKGPVYGMNRLPPQQHMYAYQQSTHTPPLQSTPACMYPQEQVFGPPIRFESPATSILSPYSEEYYGHNVPQPAVNPTLPEPGYFTKQCAVPSTQPSRSTESKSADPKMSFGSQFTGEPAKVPNFGGVGATPTTSATTAFKFNSNFKSNDGDFTFSSAQVKNSESLLGLLTSDIPPKVEVPLEPKLRNEDQPLSQGGVFTFGSKNAAEFSFTDGAQNKMNIFGNTDQRFSVIKPTLDSSESQEEKSGENDSDSTHVEEDEDGPHFEPIVPLPDKVDVKTGEEEEEEMFCKRAKLFRFDSKTKEWKERGIGSIKILKHKTSGKVRLLMRREQVLKICANHYITADMALKPNAGSAKSWVWYAMDYADEMPKTEQLAIRFKTADEAALFKVKFEEAQKFLSESPQGQQTEKKSETPQPQVSSKEADLKTLFSKKEGEWDCDVCCVRNAPTSAVCVACSTPAPSTAEVKPIEEPKGSGPVALPAEVFSFELSRDSASTDVSSKVFIFGSQTPVSFKFGSKDAAVTSAGFGAQAEMKTIQADAPQQEKMSAAPAVPFGTEFGAQIVKEEGQWDCDSCLVRNDASATECVSCKAHCSIEKSKAASQGELAAKLCKKDGEWDCDTCLVRNDGSSSHCVSCQKANSNMKNKTSAAPSSSSFTLSFGSSSSQPAVKGFKANFNLGPAFQIGTSKEKASSEGFKFESSTTEAKKSSSSSSFLFSMPAPGRKFGIAESKAKPSDRQSESGSASDLKNIAELHKEKEKEAAPSSSDQSVDADSHNNNPLSTGKPKIFSSSDLGKSKDFQFGLEDPNFKSFPGAGEQLFTGLHSSPKADTFGDQDDKMYKTKENDDIQFVPVVPLPDPVEASTGEENKEKAKTPGANLGTQSTKTVVSPPKTDIGPDSVQKIFGSPLPPNESLVTIPSSKDEETAVSRLKTSGPAVTSQSSVGTPFSILTSVTLERAQWPTASEEQRASSDSKAEAEKLDDINTELQEAQVKPKPSHDTAAVDTSDDEAEERQTDMLVADGSRRIDLFTERSSESDSSTSTDSEVTLEREKQPTANKEQRASSDSKADAEKLDKFNTEFPKLQQAQVKPKPSHDAAAVDTSNVGAEEHQTDMLVADGSRRIDLFTERSSESDSSTSTDSEVTLERKKRPTANKEQRASSDSKVEAEEPDDFNTEFQKPQEAQVKPKPSHDEAAVDMSDGRAEEHQTNTQVAGGSLPIDLSTERSSGSDSSTATGLSFGFSSVGGVTFADLAMSSGTFCKKDDNFTWSGAGARVFGSGATQTEGEKTCNEAGEEGSDNETPHNDEIHFKSTASLPEVEVKSGEEDEERRERVQASSRHEQASTELSYGNFKWPGAGAPVFGSGATQTEGEKTRNEAEEEGSDNETPHNDEIHFKSTASLPEVEVKSGEEDEERRKQVLKVCTNHTVSQNIKLKPMNTSANALVWTATDYSEAAKFKTPELAESFRRPFTDSQSRMSQNGATQMSAAEALSQESSPVGFFDITVDNEDAGREHS